MTVHSETRIVPYTADLMYAVVSDVEKYPSFLPWVVALRVLSRETSGQAVTMFAEMAVGYGAIRERYTSRVCLDPVERQIDVVQTQGPFRNLENHWHFTPMAQGCRIDFQIVFEFRSKLLSAVAGVALDHVLLRMADAFEARARVLSNQPLQ